MSEFVVYTRSLGFVIRCEIMTVCCTNRPLLRATFKFILLYKNPSSTLWNSNPRPFWQEYFALLTRPGSYLAWTTKLWWSYVKKCRKTKITNVFQILRTQQTKKSSGYRLSSLLSPSAWSASAGAWPWGQIHKHFRAYQIVVYDYWSIFDNK